MAKRITEVGRYKVLDGTRYYDPDEELSLEEIAGYERRAAVAVLCKIKGVGPDVIRYGRKSIGLTVCELAIKLGVRSDTVIRWEDGTEAINMIIQLAIAQLIYAKEMGSDNDLIIVTY